MSVQVRRRREAAAFLSSFVGAQGELLIDTTNNRVQVHDGATAGGFPAAKLSEVVTNTRTTVADAAYTVQPGDRTIAYSALTAARTVTLPAAAAYPTGTQLVIADESGTCSFTNTITVARVGTDTINGAASATIATPYGFLALISNGIGKWTIVDLVGATSAQLTNRNAVVNGNFAVNQRAYVSNTALAAGTYAHDRWKAGAGGCTYTYTQGVPDTAVTITSGTLVQVVEASSVYAGAYWLSWTGSATARVWQSSATGTYVASPLLVTGLTVGTAANLEFSTGTLGLVQFEAALPNAGPTLFERRSITLETTLCARYFQAYSGVLVAGYAGASGQTCYEDFSLSCTMRATPTISIGTVTYSSGASSLGINVAANNHVRLQLVSTAAGQIYGFANMTFSAEL